MQERLAWLTEAAAAPSQAWQAGDARALWSTDPDMGAIDLRWGRGSRGSALTHLAEAGLSWVCVLYESGMAGRQAGMLAGWLAGWPGLAMQMSIQ